MINTAQVIKEYLSQPDRKQNFVSISASLDPRALWSIFPDQKEEIVETKLPHRGSFHCGAGCAAAALEYGYCRLHVTFKCIFDASKDELRLIFKNDK